MVVPFVGAEIGIEAVGDGVKATEIAKAALFLASDESAYMTNRKDHPSLSQSMFIRNPITGARGIIILMAGSRKVLHSPGFGDARYVAIAKRPHPECRS